MTEFALFGLSLTLAIILDRLIKSRRWRARLGIAMATLGIVATFTLPLRLHETDIGIVYLIAWLSGLNMFFKRDRYEDEK